MAAVQDAVDDKPPSEKVVITAKNKGQAGSLIGLLITLIIGVAVVVSVLFSTFNDATTQVAVVNQTVTIVNGSYFNLLEPNIVSSSFVLANMSQTFSSGTTAGTYQLDTSYSRVKAITNADLLAGTYLASYNSVALTGTTRSITSLLPVFVAVLLLVIAAGSIGLGNKSRRR